MNKLIVNTGSLAGGGAERVLSILSTPLADAFDEVHYVMWLDNRYPDVYYKIDPRVKIVRISSESGTTSSLKHLIWYRKYIKREKPDLVLSFMVMIGFAATLSLVFSNVKHIVAERNDPRHFKHGWFRKLIDCSYLLPHVVGVVMQTQWNKSYFANPKILNKTTVIFNPIELNKNLIGRAGEISKSPIVVSVGRLARQKQQWVLIDAFSKFQLLYPEYKLIIYGEGSCRPQLEEQIKKLELEGKVLLPGMSKDVMEKIQEAMMFVTTSEFEGMSNALLEAMCLGLPCISTKVSGATDLIDDGVNGFLCDIGDIDAIYEKMCILIENDEIRKECSQKATLVYEKLNTNIVSTQWVAYLMSKI